MRLPEHNLQDSVLLFPQTSFWSAKVAVAKVSSLSLTESQMPANLEVLVDILGWIPNFSNWSPAARFIFSLIFGGNLSIKTKEKC